MRLLAVNLVIFAAFATIGWLVYRAVESLSKTSWSRRAERDKAVLEDIFMDLPLSRLQQLYLIAPLIGALLGGMAGWSLIGAAAGVGVGLIFPGMWINLLRTRRHKRFHAMLVDTLLLVSSCLRAGLSMLQAFTVVAEEMPAPANQELGLVLKEIRMGVSLEDAMEHLRKRMPSDEINLFVTAVLVARETGGDVTTVFTKLVETLRERKKIKEKVVTLTFMARAQGVVMGLLPVVFLGVVYKIDPKHMLFFFKDPMGQVAFAAVVVAQLLVIVLFVRFARSPM